MYEVTNGLRAILAHSLISVNNDLNRGEVKIQTETLSNAQYIHRELCSISPITERHDQQVDSADDYSVKESAKTVKQAIDEVTEYLNGGIDIDKEQIASDLGAVYSTPNEDQPYIPNVGRVCEFNTGGDSEYNQCFIVGFHPKTSRALVDHMRISGEISHAPECWNFRPIKSERDLLVEKACQELTAHFIAAISDRDEDILKAMVDLGWRPTNE